MFPNNNHCFKQPGSCCMSLLAACRKIVMSHHYWIGHAGSMSRSPTSICPRGPKPQHYELFPFIKRKENSSKILEHRDCLPSKYCRICCFIKGVSMRPSCNWSFISAVMKRNSTKRMTAPCNMASNSFAES